VSRSTFAFDSLKFVRHLKDSGFTERQAEALAEEQIAMLDHSLADLATKADIQDMATKTDIQDTVTKAEQGLRFGHR